MFEQLMLSRKKHRAHSVSPRNLPATPKATRASRAVGPDLGGDAQALAHVIGTEKALYLIGQLPRGLSGSASRKSLQPLLYVPKCITPDHFLVQLLGVDDAQALVDVFGGESIKPSTCKAVGLRFRDREILAMLADGLSARLVAEIMGVSRRWVDRVSQHRASHA